MKEVVGIYLGMGVTIVSVGIALILQGEVLRNPERSKSIGSFALGLGICLGIAGLFVMYLGITFLAS
jgi:hypothetical protein